jgi:uncharacterized Zn finger protein (UPF0148 family)
MASIKCPACGQRILNPGGLAFCPNCGEPLALQLSEPGAATSFTAEENLFSRLVIDDQSPASDRSGSDTEPDLIVPSEVTNRQYPEGFPKRPPDLEGIVVLVESHEEPKRSNGISESVFNGLLDFLWSIPGSLGSQAQSKEKEKVQVTRVRIRTADDRQRDIRIEGRLTRVNIAQGDRISLWGKQKQGLLAFQRGYNHTAEGIITTSNKANSQNSGLLIIGVMLIGIIVLLYYYHILP